MKPQCGDEVEKITGYRFPGIVRAVFTTARGQDRCVIECAVPGCEGMLHIFSPQQLRVKRREKIPDPEPEKKDTKPEHAAVTVSPLADKLALSINEACAATSIKKSMLYKLIASGELPIRKIGWRTIIMRADLDAFLAKLGSEKSARR